MDWRWRFLDSDGRELNRAHIGLVSKTEDGPPRETFATQADAETWIGEVWRDLAGHGVAAVELWRGDSLIYGPMSLGT